MTAFAIWNSDPTKCDNCDFQLVASTLNYQEYAEFRLCEASTGNSGGDPVSSFVDNYSRVTRKPRLGSLCDLFLRANRLERLNLKGASSPPGGRHGPNTVT